MKRLTKDDCFLIFNIRKMFLEKIKKNSGKIFFFIINLLVVIIGAQYLKNKNMEQSTVKTINDLSDSNDKLESALESASLSSDDNSKVISNSADNASETAMPQQGVSAVKTAPTIKNTTTTTTVNPSVTSKPTPKATTKKS